MVMPRTAPSHMNQDEPAHACGFGPFELVQQADEEHAGDHAPAEVSENSAELILEVVRDLVAERAGTDALQIQIHPPHVARFAVINAVEHRVNGDTAEVPADDVIPHQPGRSR